MVFPSPGGGTVEEKLVLFLEGVEGMKLEQWFDE